MGVTAPADHKSSTLTPHPGTFPIDTTKTRLQVQGQAVERALRARRYRGMLDAFLQISRQEGPTALYRGWVGRTRLLGRACKGRRVHALVACWARTCPLKCVAVSTRGVPRLFVCTVWSPPSCDKPPTAH